MWFDSDASRTPLSCHWPFSVTLMRFGLRGEATVAPGLPVPETTIGLVVNLAPLVGLEIVNGNADGVGAGELVASTPAGEGVAAADSVGAADAANGGQPVGRGGPPTTDGVGHGRPAA